MVENFDFISPEEREKIKNFAKKNNLFLYQIGVMCGIRDKGFWCRILHGQKPIPMAARKLLNVLVKEE